MNDTISILLNTTAALVFFYVLYALRKPSQVESNKSSLELEQTDNDINEKLCKCKQTITTNCNKQSPENVHKKELIENDTDCISDEELFKQPPPKEDCPICFLRMPHLKGSGRYHTCCGKTLCSGCVFAVRKMKSSNICPFCRTPLPSSDGENAKRLNKRMEAGDPGAMYNLGCDYYVGKLGSPQDYEKALELWHRAGELGYTQAYTNIGSSYNNGRGVEVDKKKARYYYKQAAMGGDPVARGNLGIQDMKAYNIDRALKHYMIAVRSGDSKSLDMIQKLYKYGRVSKDDYTKALRLYQEYLSEIKSPQREKAAAFSDEYRYY